jgi:ParB/RepB/Spo0J family partition protein
MTIDVATGVKLTELTEDPANVRNLDSKDEKAAIESLAASIAGVGLLQPLLVTGTLQIIDGHRRYRALQLLTAERKWNGDEVPVMVMRGDDKELKIAQLVSNLQREDLDPIQEAKMLFAIVELGESQKELATRIGMSQATVSKRLSLLSLTEAVQKLVLNDTITIEEAAKLAKVADHPKEIAEFVKEGRWYSGAVERFVTNILATDASKKLIEILVMRGWEIVDQPSSNHRHVKGYTAKAAKDALLSPKEGQSVKVVVAGGEIRVEVFRTVDDKTPEKAPRVDKRKEAHEIAERERRKEARVTARQDAVILKSEVIGASAATINELLIETYITQAGFDQIKRAAQLLDLEPQLRKARYVGGKDEKDFQTPLLQYADSSPAKKRHALLALMVCDEMHSRGPAWDWRTKVLAEADRSAL